MFLCKKILYLILFVCEQKVDVNKYGPHTRGVWGRCISPKQANYTRPLLFEPLVGI
jgi:hypothetical protein